MLPEAYKDSLIDSLISAFPNYKIFRDWNDVKRDDTDLLVVVSFGGVVSLFGTSLGNFVGKMEENPNYSWYSVGEVIPVFVTVMKIDTDGEDTRAIVQSALRELEIFIKREFDKIFNDLNVDPYSFRVSEEPEIGTKTHRVMILSFKLIYTNKWNDMPPENPKDSHDVKEITITEVNGPYRIRVRI